MSWESKGMSEDDWKSREFWEKVIDYSTLLMMVGMGILVYNAAGFLAKNSIDIGIFADFFVILIMTGVPAFIHHVFMQELDRRFPSFDKNCGYIQRMRNEINYNAEQARKGRQ